MGFDWDAETYTEGGNGVFIKEAEFNKLVYTDATVQIVEIREGISNYNNKEKPQWLVDFISADGEEYTKGISKGNEERDARINRIKSTLESSGEPFECRFVKIGRRFDIGKALTA